MLEEVSRNELNKSPARGRNAEKNRLVPLQRTIASKTSVSEQTVRMFDLIIRCL